MDITKNRKENRRSNSRGIHGNRLMIPIIIILAVLHVCIITLIMSINTTSSSMSKIMQDSGNYIEDATSILAGSSLLSETSTNFVLVPQTETGEVNIFPLNAYAGELQQDRRGHQVLERFQSYEVSKEVLAEIEQAAGCAETMLEAQLHALALMTSVYPLPDEALQASIPMPELTAEEAAMPAEQRIGLAHRLIMSSEYAQNKSGVSVHVNTATGMIRGSMGSKAAEIARRIALLRTALWTITSLIIIILVLTFIGIYRQILSPLNVFTKLIRSSNPLNETLGLVEVRSLAVAYNGLLRRRDALDNILRSAAATDTLTNLPNRYGYEQYILEIQERSCAVALLVFDVNLLKETNDRFGHAAGDQLLRSSAECIENCFGSEAEHNCFRFGGDEFAAVVKGATLDEVERMVAQFQEAQQNRQISIAWGCAYTEDITETNFQEMMEEADQEMYDRKKVQHSALKLIPPI